MNTLHIIVVILQVLGITHASSTGSTNKTDVGKYYLAPGSVTNSLVPNDHYDAPARRFLPLTELFELRHSDVHPAIHPGAEVHEESDTDSKETDAASHDGLNRRSCPYDKPWICVGRTCFNFYEYNCCKGGLVCKDPQLCITNAVGNIACK